MDIYETLKKLAETLFSAFSHAVQEYPLPTAVVFIAAAFIYWQRLEEGEKLKHKPVLACLIFICAVVAANVVGWIFNAVLWVLKTLFGWSEVFVGPFAKDPVAFLISVLAASILGCLYLAYRYGYQPRRIPTLAFASMAMVALFVAYVSTNIYVQLAGHPEPAAKSAESKKG